MEMLVLISTLASIHILQMGDSDHLNLHTSCVETIRRLARANKYNYSVGYWNKTQYECPYTAKVAMLHRHVKAANNGDWVAWVDVDVKYQHPSFKAWQSRFFASPCEFVILRTDHTLNTGVVHIKATRRMRIFLSKWLAEQVEKQYCDGPADQLSLQTVFMRQYVPHYSGECEKIHEAHAKNVCFKTVTRNVQIAPLMCMLNCGSGLQRHDCNSACHPTDIFCHHHRC